MAKKSEPLHPRVHGNCKHYAPIAGTHLMIGECKLNPPVRAAGGETMHPTGWCYPCVEAGADACAQWKRAT